MGDEDIDPRYLLAALMHLQNRSQSTGQIQRSTNNSTTTVPSSLSSLVNNNINNEEEDNEEDEAEVQRLQQELYAKQQELLELKRIANSLNVYLQDTNDDETTLMDENDTTITQKRKLSNEEEEGYTNALSRTNNRDPMDAEDNEEDIAGLMQQLQNAMANAASLQAEADRLTSMRDTLQESLNQTRNEEQQTEPSVRKQPPLPNQSSQYASLPSSSVPSSSTVNNSKSVRNGGTMDEKRVQPKKEVPPSTTTTTEEDISDENLLPFLQAEMQHLAMQASAMDRGETINDNTDPNAVINAMQQRLELLNKLEKLMHMEAILKAAAVNEDNTNDQNDDNDNANYGNEIAAVHALPEDFPVSNSKSTGATTTLSSSTSKPTIPSTMNNEEDNDQLNEEDTAILQAKLAELRMLEARATALRERRDELMQRVNQEEGRALSSKSTSTTVSSSTVPTSSVSASTKSFSSEESIDFSIFEPMDQIVIVRSRLALMSACMESPNFNEMVAYAVATLGTDEEKEDARLATQADSRSAGPPAFIKAVGIAAILRNAVRKAAVYASRTMTQSVNSVQELLESDEFTEAFRQETVKALLSRIPVAQDMMSNGMLDSEASSSSARNAYIGNNNAQEVDLSDKDEEEITSTQPPTGTNRSRTSSPIRTNQNTHNTTNHSIPEYNVVDMSIASTTNTTATVPASSTVNPPSVPSSTTHLSSTAKSVTNANSNTSSSSTSAAPKKLSTFDRLALPRRDRIVPKAESKTENDTNKKPEFRTWPKKISQNTKMPKTMKVLPKVPDISAERKGESTYDGSSLGDVEYIMEDNDTENYGQPINRAMDEFDSLTATANAWASKSRIPGAADLVSRALLRVNSASTGFNSTTPRLNIDTDVSPFAVEEALVSPRVMSILHSSRDEPIHPVPAVSPRTQSRFAELAASKRASSPTSRTKTGWNMPSYTAVNAIPPLRVFDATQSSAKRTAETTQHIRTVFPYVTTAAIPPGTAALIAEEEAAKHHHKITSSIEDEIASQTSLPRPRSPPKGSLNASSRPSSPVKAFDASVILGKDAVGISSGASVISGTRSTSRRQRAGSSGASVVSSSQRSVTAFNRSVSPSKPNQMGRPTMIHATKLLIPTQVLGPVWAKIAGNIPENRGRGRFRILRYSKVPPPPPAYWFTSANEGKRSQGLPTNPITSVLSDLRSEVRSVAKETINSPTGVDNLMKGLPPRSTSPRSPALQKIDSFFNGSMLGTFGDASKFGTTNNVVNSLAASVNNGAATRLNFSSAGSTNVVLPLGLSTITTNTVPTPLPSSPRVYSLPAAATLAKNTNTNSTVRNITLSDLDANDTIVDAVRTRSSVVSKSNVSEIRSPKPTLETVIPSSFSSSSLNTVTKPPLSSRPSLLNISSHIDDTDNFVGARNSRVLQRVPSLAEVEEAKVEEVAQIIMKARDRISTVSSAVNSRTAVTDSAFGPNGILHAIDKLSSIPSAAVIVTYGEDDDSDHETQKQSTRKRDALSITTEPLSQEKNITQDDKSLLEHINKANTIALNRIATASFRIQSSSHTGATKSTTEHLRDVELEAELVEDDDNGNEDDSHGDEDIPEEGNGYEEEDDDDDEEGESDEAKVHPEPVVSVRAQSAASILLEPAGTGDARPTTSRKVPHPGVDDFYSYVRTSPSKMDNTTTGIPTQMSNDVAARVALAKAGIVNQSDTLLQAPQQVDAALLALRRQAAVFEARAKMRMQGTEPDTASDDGGEGFDLGDDEVEIHQGTDDHEYDNEEEEDRENTYVNRTGSLSLLVDNGTGPKTSSVNNKPENRPYDYSEEIIRNNKSSPYKSTVPPIWAKALLEGHTKESVTNKNVQFGDEIDADDTDGQSSVTTDLDHMDANAIIASAEAEVLAEMMQNHHIRNNDNDSNDGSSTVEADAQLAAGILRAADERLNYSSENDENNDENGYPDRDTLDASLNTSYLTALAETEKQVVEQRRMVAELQDFIPSVSPKKNNNLPSQPPQSGSRLSNNDTIFNDVLLTKNGLFQRLSPAVPKPNSYVSTAEYEMAAANLAARNNNTPSVARNNGNTVTSFVNNYEEEEEEMYDNDIIPNDDDNEENDDELIQNTNQPLPAAYPGRFLDDQEEGSISSWTHADSENNLHIPEAYSNNPLDHSASNSNNAVSRRLATLRRRSRKWSTEFKQRRAVALAVALRTINSWGTSVTGSPGASAPRPLRIQELEELVLDIGSALTGLAPGILALGNQENLVKHSQSNDIDEDEGITSNVLATQNLLNPLSILSRRRKVTIAGATLHGIQAFAYSVWMTARPSLHAALLCYIGADAKAPATQKWLLRDVRTGLADWASVSSAALMDTSSSASTTFLTKKSMTTSTVPIVGQSVSSPLLSPTTKAMRLTGVPTTTATNQRSSGSAVPPPPVPISKTNNFNLSSSSTKFTLPSSVNGKTIHSQPTTNAARVYAHQRYAMQSDGTWAAVEDSFSTDDTGENKSISSNSERDLVFHSSVPNITREISSKTNTINIKPGGKIELRPPQPNPALGPDDLNQHTFINAHLLASLARNMPNNWNQGRK